MTENSTTLHSGYLSRDLTGTSEPASTDALIPPTGFLLFKTYLQRTLAHIFVLPFCGIIAFILKNLCKYKIEDRDMLRAQFQTILKDRSPLIICSNHLTFIDSAIIIWALSSNSNYFFNFRSFTWNLPAGDFFKKKFRYRFVAYFSKCIFIHRDGTKEHKNSILGLCHYLLEKGEIITLFPEGRRSRTGSFEKDKLTLGAARLISNLSNCRVLTMYVRGNNQKTYSNYPPKGARFKILMEVINPPPAPAERGKKDYQIQLMKQIGQSIDGLEKSWLV